MLEALHTFEEQGLLFAAGARAGNWVFASGINGRAEADPRRPLSGAPLAYLQAKAAFERTLQVLQAGGVDFRHAVRTDQFFSRWQSVPFFHQARREACGSYIAPSTSILEPLAGAMTMDVIASRKKPAAVFPARLDVPATSSFAPVATTGDFVFVAGFLAAHGAGDLGGVAPEAKVPEGHLWKGNRIQLEADYIIRQKLVPALDGAGCQLADTVKAVVYLADIADVPGFNQVWARHFADRPPATTFVPTLVPGFAIGDARCEINLVAYKGERNVMDSDVRPACDDHPVAIAAGDLVFTSGLLDEAAQALGEIADLSRALRIQMFYTEEAALLAACQELQGRAAGKPLPISAVRVPGPLLIPECAVQIDAWIYRGTP